MMAETEDVGTGKDLARFLDPTGDPWTRPLLQLAAPANPVKLAGLREAIPAQVVTWEVWSKPRGHPVRRVLRALAGLIWWPGRNGIPTAETIAAMVADYKHGRIAMPRAGHEPHPGGRGRRLKVNARTGRWTVTSPAGATSTAIADSPSARPAWPCWKP